MTAPTLAIYNAKRTKKLHTDASAKGYGAALMQKQDDGRFHPVACFSKATTPAESNYPSFELETLAIVYALERFKIYLKGIPFTVITDCNALAQTLDKKHTNTRIARWTMYFSDYNFTIQHRPGCSMTHVDALSRCIQAAVADVNDIDFQLLIAQSRDPNIVGLRSKLENTEVKDFKLLDGLVYKKDANGKALFYVPQEMEDNIIRLTHEKLAHQSVDKCCNQIKMQYWFPNMKNKVEIFIRNCIRCLVNAAPLRTNERNLHSIEKKPIPFDTIHVDHFSPLPALAVFLLDTSLL